MSRTQAWAAAAVAVIALAAGAGLAWWNLSPSVSGISGEPFFLQSYKDLDGQLEPMSRWRGQLVVVNFWATWCAPCVEEMPDLQRVHDEYASRGVAVIGLGIDAPSALSQFRNEHRLSLPLYAAGASGSELGRKLGNTAGALPYTVLIDGKGRIVESHLGQVRPAELRRWLEAQLGQPSG